MACDGVGDVISHAEMQRRARCRQNFGTVRWCGAEAEDVLEAHIVTRLGIEDDPSMPTYDRITTDHFFLVDAGMNAGGPTVILRQAAVSERPIIRLFYRRGKGKGFQDLGQIEFDDEMVTRDGSQFYKFRRLCSTPLNHSETKAPGDET